MELETMEEESAIWEQVKFIRAKRLAKGSPTLSAEIAERVGHPEEPCGLRDGHG
jgi:hypothetical protein